MQIVIDIPENKYNTLRRLFKINNGMRNCTELEETIACGVPLPKGHGRLIDADSFLESYDICGYIEDMEVDYFNTVTPTIIGADRER